MRKLLAELYRMEAIIAGSFLVAMVALIFVGGLARLAHRPLSWTIDLATCLFAWACFLAADIAWRNDGLMAVNTMTDRLPERWQKALRFLNYGIITVFLIYLAVMGVYLSWISRVRSFQGIPGVSYSWVTMSLPFGAALLLLTTFRKVRAELKGLRAENRAVDVL